MAFQGGVGANSAPPAYGEGEDAWASSVKDSAFWSTLQANTRQAGASTAAVWGTARQPASHSNGSFPMANGWSELLLATGAVDGATTPAAGGEGGATASEGTSDGIAEPALSPAGTYGAKAAAPRAKRGRGSKSGGGGDGSRRGPARGVTFDDVTGKWRVRLRMQGGKETALGYYWDSSVAVKAVNLARELQGQGWERLRISEEVKRRMLPEDAPSPQQAEEARHTSKRQCTSGSGRAAHAAAVEPAVDGFAPVAGVQLMRDPTTGQMKWRTYHVNPGSEPTFLDVNVSGQATDQLPMIVSFLQTHCPAAQ